MIKSVKSSKKNQKIVQYAHNKRPVSQQYEPSRHFNRPTTKMRVTLEPESNYKRFNQRKISLSQKKNKQNYQLQNNMAYPPIMQPSIYFDNFRVDKNRQDIKLPRQKSDNKIFTKLFRQNYFGEDIPGKIEAEKMVYHNEYGNIVLPKNKETRPKSKAYQNVFEKFFQQSCKVIKNRESSNRNKVLKKVQDPEYSTNQSVCHNEFVNTSKSSIKFDMSPYLY